MKELPFEQAFKRLEEILERMNSSDITLEESLKLFEEANSLVILSQKRLQEAEKRIEILVRTRQGELAVDEKGTPMTTPLPKE